MADVNETVVNTEENTENTEPARRHVQGLAEVVALGAQDLLQI